jgi:hypothetical protein
MKDVIDILLKKQETLEGDREAEKALACEKIDAEYAVRSHKIAALLDLAGYVPETEEATDAATPAVDAAENVEQRSTISVY